MSLERCKYSMSLRVAMDMNIGFADSVRVWSRASELSKIMEKENAGNSVGVKKHTDDIIYPIIAIYKAIRELGYDEEKALQVVGEAMMNVCKPEGERYANLLTIPGLKYLFLKIFSSQMKTKFGDEAGFIQCFEVNNSREVLVNTTKCVYNDCCIKYECPELTKLFCMNDEYHFGNLPGVTFERNGTLGTGYDICDFHFRI